MALFSAARRELWREKIQPALERGEIVLSARNYISTISLSGARRGYGRVRDFAIDEVVY